MTSPLQSPELYKLFQNHPYGEGGRINFPHTSKLCTCGQAVRPRGGTDREASWNHGQHAVLGEALSVYTCRMPFRAHANLVASRVAGATNDAAFVYHPPERIGYEA